MGEELDSAAWKGAASRAVGARGGRHELSGGLPPSPTPLGSEDLVDFDVYILGVWGFRTGSSRCRHQLDRVALINFHRTRAE